MTTKFLIASISVAALSLSGCSYFHKEDKMMKDAPAAEAPAAEAPAAEAPAAEAPAAEAPAAAEPSSNPAADACYEKGGSVVQWYDADGETIDACRTSDGSEYSLDDYLSYGG